MVLATMGKEQNKLYDYLVDYVTDSETALKIIKGGYQGYCYAGCGYEVVDNNTDPDYLKEQEFNLISDTYLDYDYLVGGMI